MILLKCHVSPECDLVKTEKTCGDHSLRSYLLRMLYLLLTWLVALPGLPLGGWVVAGKHLPSMTSKAGSESEPVGGGEAMPPGPPPALAPGPPPADIHPLQNFLLKLLLFFELI